MASVILAKAESLVETPIFLLLGMSCLGLHSKTTYFLSIKNIVEK